MDSCSHSKYSNVEQVEDSLYTNSATDYLSLTTAYKDSIVGSFPELPRAALDNCSMFSVDTLAMGYFLENYPKKVTILEVGAFVGVSAFFFASHPKVSSVMSVDPNLVVAEELTANSDVWHRKIDLDSLRGKRTLEVARETLERFPEQRDKIKFHEGVIGTKQIGAKGKQIEDLDTVQVPEIPESTETGLIAVVDGLHTKDGVLKDLQAIFDRNPRAIVFLDDCRHRWGPLVQAGAVEFMEQASEEYQFKLVGDIATGLSSSNFGVVYPASSSKYMSDTFAEVGDVFSERLDPIRLLGREETLVGLVNQLSEELQQTRNASKKLEQRNSELEHDIEHLRNHYASQRYKLADTVVGNAMKVPVAKRFKSLLR